MTTNSNKDLKKTVGDSIDIPSTPSQENGAEFGLRPRTPGLFYLKKFPSKELVKRMVKDGIFMLGIDVVDGEKWHRWEKESITRSKEKKRLVFKPAVPIPL